MSDFAAAMQLYHTGRVIVDATHELAIDWFSLRIDRQDLEEALMDLKLAVIDEHLEAVRRRSAEVNDLIGEIIDKLAKR